MEEEGEERISEVFALLKVDLIYQHLYTYDANTDLCEYGYFLVPLVVPNKNHHRRYHVPK